MSPADLFKTYPGFPSLLCLLLLVPFAVRTVPAGRTLGSLLGLAVAGTALVALALAALNALVPDFVDNVEPPVVGNAWIWWHGGAMYPPPDGGTGTGAVPELRGLLYGPLTFILAGLVPTLAGGTVLIAKLPALLSFAGIVVLVWFACRRLGALWPVALAATSATTVALSISEAPYWVRGDTVLMLIAAFCTWLVARPARRPVLRSLLLGVLAGSASAIKLHGAVYVAPACLLAVLDAASLIPVVPTLEAPPRTRPWRVTARAHLRWVRAVLCALAIVAAAAVAVAWPFVLDRAGVLHGISLDNYLAYLRLAAHHGLSRQLLMGNLTLVLGVALPLAVLAWQLRATGRRLSLRWVILSGAVLACALLVAVIASKPGAGYPHLLPFLPYAGLLLCVLLAGLRVPGAPLSSARVLGVAVLFCVAFCVPVLVRAATFAGRRAEFAAIAAAHAQVRDVLATHPGETVAVGYGGDSFLDLRLSYLRILPVFADARLPYDATAMDDLWQGGLDPRLSLPGIEACGVRVWLLPAGSEPFSLRNFYGGTTFPDAFRTLFAARYQAEPVRPGLPMQIWTCRAPRPAG